MAYAQDIANRLDNGIDSFYENLRQVVPTLTDAECAQIFTVYKRYKIVKRDFVSGKWSVKHGAYLEITPIQNALKSK